MVKEERHIIWQDSVYEDEEQWRDAWEDYKSEFDRPDISLDDFIAMSNDIDDERANLDVDIPDGIIVIANLGLWNGTRAGYLKTEPTNVRDCLYSHCNGYMKFYVEDGEFRAEESHHDGTNYYTFRKWRKGVSEEQKDELRANVEDAGLIERLTESLADDIAKVYGW